MLSYLELLNNKDIDADTKWFCILNLLHNEKISLDKAFELAEENGLIEHSRLQIDCFINFLNIF